ncbi:hypothetical protein G647_08586 [Cladophialophora carrionii CBS 160.54]|uniref:Uncharacterized protein n=1 Tax=Cladophialophora carrionii CBS 160.54 TaxID=1279043 RepID=V9D0U2_9EURO|nr:uncharacterized protein G647_08586 [Cladophialophora carrionii CBS 160.54]ETI20549.1 hypothetical protein G647_08586 [Cladophialophora carrionii CBS 160.54]
MASPLMVNAPQATLHSLNNADGSATYSAPHHSYKIVAGVNYPVEVPYRSDELPESTFVEVNLRPHNGVGMVKERHVEDLIKRTLQALVLGEETPRTMLQVTLQIVSVETDESLPGGVKGGGQGETYLDMLASALNAAMLACLDAGVQMRTIAGAAVIGLSRDGQIVVNPDVVQRQNSSSLHVFAFTQDGKTLLMESEGRFGMDHLKRAEHAARLAVVGQGRRANNNNKTNARDASEVATDAYKLPNGDVAMNGTDHDVVVSVLDVMRKAMVARVIKDESWRQD